MNRRMWKWWLVAIAIAFALVVIVSTVIKRVIVVKTYERLKADPLFASTMAIPLSEEHIVPQHFGTAHRINGMVIWNHDEDAFDIESDGWWVRIVSKDGTVFVPPSHSFADYHQVLSEMFALLEAEYGHSIVASMQGGVDKYGDDWTGWIRDWGSVADVGLEQVVAMTPRQRREYFARIAMKVNSGWSAECAQVWLGKDKTCVVTRDTSTAGAAFIDVWWNEYRQHQRLKVQYVQGRLCELVRTILGRIEKD